MPWVSRRTVPTWAALMPPLASLTASSTISAFSMVTQAGFDGGERPVGPGTALSTGVDAGHGRDHKGGAT